MTSIEGSFSFNFAENTLQELQNKAQMSGKSGSWLVQFATVMGEIANKISDQMMEKAGEIDTAAENEEPANELTAELTALSQLFKMLTEATNNVIKSVGEGNSALARKQ